MVFSEMLSTLTEQWLNVWSNIFSPMKSPGEDLYPDVLLAAQLQWPVHHPHNLVNS